METKNSWILGWLLALGLVATGLVGCDSNSPKIVWEGFNVEARGIVSDTTAMLAVSYLESFEYDNGGDGHNYLGRGLKLVDVRFDKVYWEARVDDINSSFKGSQLSDSTMLLNGPKGLWLWTVGQSAPKKLELTWATEKMELDTAYLRLRTWKDGMILLLNCDFCYGKERNFALIDTAQRTISKWIPSEGEQWVMPCQDLQWGSIGGLCLSSINFSCDFALIKEGADTLSILNYSQECSPFHAISFWGGYVGFFNKTNIHLVSYPYDATISMYAITVEGRIKEPPVFWLSEGGAWFIDSLGNVIRYRL